MAETSIEWTDKTWNPLRGCSKVSPGCTNCYAMHQAARFSDAGQPYEGLAKRNPTNWTGVVRTVREKLAEPLSWRKPCRVFVNSMSDLFHEDIPDDYIAAVFGVMASCPQHTFQVLTKRASRLPEWFAWFARQTEGRFRIPAAIEHAACALSRGGQDKASGRMFGLANANAGRNHWPLPNVWLGVSVEDQTRADERIPHLLRTPAAVRFLSVEPLLGPVNLTDIGEAPDVNYHDSLTGEYRSGSRQTNTGKVDWVIVGGESGQDARLCDLGWIRGVVRQCAMAGVPCFVKQLGSLCWDESRWECNIGDTNREYCKQCRVKLRHPKGGDPAEWPEDLRVRQFPEVAHA